MTMFNMQIGEVAPGGIRSGLYGLLLLAVISVFIAGLMVGRTPEYLGNKIRAREMTLSTTFILATELAVLVGTGIAMAFPGPRDAARQIFADDPGARVGRVAGSPGPHAGVHRHFAHPSAQFVGLVAAVTVILCALTFLPALALGPLAEGIH